MDTGSIKTEESIDIEMLPVRNVYIVVEQVSRKNLNLDSQA